MCNTKVQAQKSMICTAIEPNDPDTIRCMH